MTLYINFIHLSRFEALYSTNETLQDVIERDTGIKWKVDDEADTEEIGSMLDRNKIKHQWDDDGK